MGKLKTILIDLEDTDAVLELPTIPDEVYQEALLEEAKRALQNKIIGTSDEA